jgi:TorA maturation chaperone TorD
MSAIEPASLLAPEDAARADLYALLAHLFHSAPTAQLLEAIAGADDIAAHSDAQTPLAIAWRQLQAACATTDAQAAADEYRELFLGVGRAPVPLQASWHRTGFLNEKPLSELRSDLAAMGLSRLQSVNETEDHVSALAEAMRILIAEGASGEPDALDEQKRFFSRHVQPWYPALAAQIEAMPQAGFYRVVGLLMRTFFDTEAAQFESF